jgi:glycosyltransferase involved in cell wall biosynthesis
VGCDVQVWANSGPGFASDQFDEAGIPWAIHPSCWPCRKRHIPRFIWRVIRTAQALRRENPDVILGYCPRPCISAGLAWSWSPAKVCIWGQRNTGDLRGDLVERFAYHRCSAVICNAEHEVDYLRQTLGETLASVYVVHNGIDMSRSQNTSTEWRTKLEISEGAIVATMLANFRFQKDHPTLLRAWRKVLDNIPESQQRPHLLLAGAHQESFESTYQLASNLGLLNSIHFLDHVKDVSGLLAASDIGILTTENEGLSNAILEYMASGLPVVATDLPGNHEALGDYPNQLFCKPGDPDNLASVIQALLQNQSLRGELSKRNFQRASKEFSVEAMIEKMVSIICDLLIDSHRSNKKG